MTDICWPDYVLENLGVSHRVADVESIDLPDFVVHAALLGEFGSLASFGIPHPVHRGGVGMAEKTNEIIDHLLEHAC
jgi:hypothetical protein